MRLANELVERSILRKSRLDNTLPESNTAVSSGFNAGISTTGSWLPFGLLDITPLDTGDGFILSDTRYGGPG